MTAESVAETVRLPASAASVPAPELVGTPLDRTGSWQVPGHGELVLVVDTAAGRAGELTAPELAGTVTMFGLSRRVDLGFTATGDGRLVSTAGVPGLGAFTRTGGLAVTGDDCAVAVLVAADRGPFTTVAGLGGLGAAVVFGVLMVVLARRTGGGWWRRFGVAGPLGLLAGAGEAVLLHDAGTFDPASRLSWWLPVVGLALAAALPWTRRHGWLVWHPVGRLTRWRRRAPEPLPAPAQVGRWQPGTRFARTERFEVWRASADGGSGAGPEDGPVRALVKVPVAGSDGDPAVRLMLAREAAVLSRVDHPNCVGLVEHLDGDDGPIAVVMEPVDGVALGAVLAGPDRLSGPQAVTVILGVLAGLEAVHELGLVHRGVQPENVWLDVTGGVLVAGLELACPGMEHPLAPESGTPYTSPEQRRGEPLDPRADLWSCGAVLAELLTGQVPEPDASGRIVVGGLPEPVAALLGEVLAVPMTRRPGSAAEFADRLRQVAQAAYGPDWPGRAALGAAVLAYGAIAAATAGYAIGGAGAAGAAAPIMSGLGAATTAGLGTNVAGAVQASGLGTATAATQGGSAAATAAAVGTAGGASAGAVANASTGGGAATGKVATAAVPAATAAVAVVVGIVGAVAGAPPAAAATEVITPEAAQVIFVRTVDHAREDDYRYLADEAVEQVADLWAYEAALRAGGLVEIVVGVPPGQYDYPAWFVATAELHAGDTVAHLFSRFDRASVAEPWLATILGWSAYPVVGPPELNENGWLVPLPDEPNPSEEQSLPDELPADVELVIDPTELPQRYADWYNRSLAAGEVLSDDLLELAPWLDETGLNPATSTFLANQVLNAVFFREGSSRWESVATPDPAEPSVRLQDAGTAIVTFTVVAETTRWARDDDQYEPCRNSSTSDAISDFGRHAQIGIDHHMTAEAMVPVRQPWRGESIAEPVTVVIDDNWGNVSQVYVPERSVRC